MSDVQLALVIGWCVGAVTVVAAIMVGLLVADMRGDE